MGRETADLVYTDRSGAFTKYLRQECVGMFPFEGRDFAARPVEYYLEVKTSVHDYDAVFYMSHGQYKRVSATRI